MSEWLDCEDCGTRHRVGMCPAGAERAVADPARDALGAAARALIDAANDAARARQVYESARVNNHILQSLSSEEYFAQARTRRAADANAQAALESYIDLAKLHVSPSARSGGE